MLIPVCRLARARIAAIVLACRLVLGCSTAPDEHLVPRTFAELAAWTSKFLESHVGPRAPGVVAFLFDPEHPAIRIAHGLADPARQTPMVTDTVFQVASISKTAAAYGVLALAARSQVEMDTPVQRYLTRCTFPHSRWDSERVTVRGLLSHTAGLSVTGYPGFEPGHDLPTIEESLAGETGLFYGFYSPGAVRIVREPGSGWRYSGGGYTVLQLLMEERSGQEFPRYMEERVLAPLGMVSSTFDASDVDPGRLAIGHDRRGRPVPNYLFTEMAAAGLYSTAEDLARLLRDLAAGVAGDHALLPSPLYREMTTGYATVEGPVTMGLGFHLDRLADGTTLAFHYGGNQGWQSFFGVRLERSEGLVILTNTDRGIDELIDPVLEVYRRYLTRAWGS